MSLRNRIGTLAPRPLGQGGIGRLATHLDSAGGTVIPTRDEPSSGAPSGGSGGSSTTGRKIFNAALSGLDFLDAAVDITDYLFVHTLATFARHILAIPKLVDIPTWFPDYVNTPQSKDFLDCMGGCEAQGHKLGTLEFKNCVANCYKSKRLGKRTNRQP